MMAVPAVRPIRPPPPHPVPGTVKVVVPPTLCPADDWTYIAPSEQKRAMATEDLSLRYQDLDAWPNSEILSALYEGQLSAVAAVRAALPAISAAADAAVEKLRI